MLDGRVEVAPGDPAGGRHRGDEGLGEATSQRRGHHRGDEQRDQGDQREVANAAGRLVDGARDDQHRRVSGDGRDRRGHRGVDEVGARTPAHLVALLQRGDVEIGGGDPRGEGAGQCAFGSESDHVDRREVTGLAHHRELASDPDLGDRGALGERLREGLTLSRQLLLSGRDRRPLDEVEAHDSRREQGERHEEHHGEGEAASHPSRYPTPQTVASGSSSPSFLRSWRTCTSTVRSSPNQPSPQTPFKSWRRESASPRLSAR